MSRESKIAVLESLLVRVQCRANEPRASQLAVAGAVAVRRQAAVAPAPEISRAPAPEISRAPAPEISRGPARPVVEAKAPAPEARAPAAVEEPQGLAALLEPEEVQPAAPPSTPRLREEIAPKRIESPPAARPKPEAPPPKPEPPPPVLEMDLSLSGESGPPPPAAGLPPLPPSPAAELPPAPLELVESAEPPKVHAEAASVRLKIEPGPGAPPMTVEVRADAIRPPERAAVSIAVFEGEAKRFVPKSFGELLEASLGLGND